MLERLEAPRLVQKLLFVELVERSLLARALLAAVERGRLNVRLEGALLLLPLLLLALLLLARHFLPPLELHEAIQRDGTVLCLRPLSACLGVAAKLALRACPALLLGAHVERLAEFHVCLEKLVVLLKLRDSRVVRA